MHGGTNGFAYAEAGGTESADQVPDGKAVDSEDMERRQYQMEKHVHALMEGQKTIQQEMQLPPKQDLETDTSSQIHPYGYPGPAAAAIQKSALFDGSIPWDTYQLHFEAVAKMNHWGEQDKAAHLTISLRGPAT